MIPPNSRIDAAMKKDAAMLPRPVARRWLSAMLFVAVLAAADIVFFRLQIWNGFSVLFSDRNDGVIEDAILEHWFNVVRSFSLWSEVSYFYPHDKTLGYTDGYFLFGLIHAIFRSVGFDPFLSSELVNVVIKSIGLAAFFAACRRIVGLSIRLGAVQRIPFYDQP